jgi:ankyrin repeat protein
MFSSKPSDLNLKDVNGLTPLIWAVDRGHLEACKLLLDAGADPSVQDNEGITPLEYAETCEHNEIINILKQRLL